MLCEYDHVMAYQDLISSKTFCSTASFYLQAAWHFLIAALLVKLNEVILQMVLLRQMGRSQQLTENSETGREKAAGQKTRLLIGIPGHGL